MDCATTLTALMHSKCAHIFTNFHLSHSKPNMRKLARPSEGHEEVLEGYRRAAWTTLSLCLWCHTCKCCGIGGNVKFAWRKVKGCFDHPPIPCVAIHVCQYVYAVGLKAVRPLVAGKCVGLPFPHTPLLPNLVTDQCNELELCTLTLQPCTPWLTFLSDRLRRMV
eukprot:1149926-Pelagomonas_calceolata.AAC.5